MVRIFVKTFVLVPLRNNDHDEILFFGGEWIACIVMIVCGINIHARKIQSLQG